MILAYKQTNINYTDIPLYINKLAFKVMIDLDYKKIFVRLLSIYMLLTFSVKYTYAQEFFISYNYEYTHGKTSKLISKYHKLINKFKLRKYKLLYNPQIVASKKQTKIQKLDKKITDLYCKVGILKAMINSYRSNNLYFEIKGQEFSYGSSLQLNGIKNYDSSHSQIYLAPFFTMAINKNSKKYRFFYCNRFIYNKFANLNIYGHESKIIYRKEKKKKYSHHEFGIGLTSCRNEFNNIFSYDVKHYWRKKRWIFFTETNTLLQNSEPLYLDIKNSTGIMYKLTNISNSCNYLLKISLVTIYQRYNSFNQVNQGLSVGVNLSYT